MKAIDINNMTYNPQKTSRILHHFISGGQNISGNKLKFELIYFALPIVFDDILLQKLVKSNANTTLSTLLNTAAIKNAMGAKTGGVGHFKAITNQSLIYLGSKVKLLINDFIECSEVIRYQDEKNSIANIYGNAAYKLGSILAKEDYRNVFVKTEIIII